MRAGSFADGWVNMARFWQALFTENSSFSVSGSSLAPLINLIAGGAAGGAQTFTTAQLQTALDKIDVKKAKKYKNALKILIDDYVDVCYTGVDDFKGKELSRSMNVQVVLPAPTLTWGTWNGKKSGYVEWDSAKFDLKAEVFQIVPATAANRWEIGFVQHCTKKENKGKYSNSDILSQHPVPAAPWGDSNPTTAHPWYTKGNHNGQIAWAKLAVGINEKVAYGMDDSFDKRKHPYTSVRGTGVVAATKIDKLDCEQDFTTWLSRFDPSTNSTVLLKKISYSIRGEFTVSAANQVGGARSSVKIDAAETPALTAALPPTSVQCMNSVEQWFCGNIQI